LQRPFKGKKQQKAARGGLSDSEQQGRLFAAAQQSQTAQP